MSIDNRRNFVKASAASFMIVAPHVVRGSQANSALTLGLVGCGNRGMYVSGLFAKNENLRVAAFTDIYEDKFAAAAANTPAHRRERNRPHCSAATSMRLTPPRLSSPRPFRRPSMPATHLPRKAGRRERRRCHKVLRAARRADPTKRISMDYQQRYGTDYRKAREVVKSGELGAIKQIRAAWMGGGPAIAKGHAASEEKIRNWFFYRELSGDILIEQDCHNIDVVNWFMDTHPVKVTGYGSQGIASTATSMTTWRHLPVRRWYGLFLHANKFRTPGWSDVSGLSSARKVLSMCRARATRSTAPKARPKWPRRAMTSRSTT